MHDYGRSTDLLSQASSYPYGRMLLALQALSDNYFPDYYPPPWQGLYK